MKFDNVSFSKEGFEKFKTLTKEKQIEKLANMLNPKDEQRAIFLLKDVPYGNIICRNEPKAEIDNGEGTSERNAKPSRNRQGKNTPKSED